MLKKQMYLGLVALWFAGACKSVHQIPVPASVENSVDLPEKKVALTEAQQKVWSHKDLAKDTIPGMSIQQAYAFLGNRKSVPVLVAVLDSGIDLEHEDLQAVLWKNPKEIPDNNQDDDGNGFVDDVHGWNFLGGINQENLELTRLVKKYQKQFEGLEKEQVKDTVAYQKYLELKKTFDEKAKAGNEEKEQYKQYLVFFKKAHDFLTKATGKEDYTLVDVKKIPPSEDQTYKMSISIFTQISEQGGTLKEQIAGLENYMKHSNNRNYDLDFNPRKDILKDDEDDFTVTVYGDNNPKNYDENELHGTHVAGIILAENDNEKGVNGVTKNALLMAVRVVPDGDEYDKDIALGIRYAVDNGAKIINTSFGKGYSPHKEKVFEAIKYAAAKDVLIVNAAGNDSKNIDVEKTYPNDSADLQTEISDNVLTIGAIGSAYGERMVAPFSNYGKKNVDIFAPGYAIYAPVPGDDYQPNSGTSMAAPAAAGVAAILRSYFPELSASQVKHIIMNSGTKIPFKVKKPGSGEDVDFSALCVSGRIVNAYNAVRMAAAMLKK